MQPPGRTVRSSARALLADGDLAERRVVRARAGSPAADLQAIGRHERDNDSPTAVTVDNVRSRIMFSLYQQTLSTPR